MPSKLKSALIVTSLVSFRSTVYIRLGLSRCDEVYAGCSVDRCLGRESVGMKMNGATDSGYSASRRLGNDTPS